MNYFSIIIFLYGITLGSFYNVVGLRIPVKKSIVSPRSACTSCGHELTAWELIPVFSYMMLRGKCRQCSARVSPLYPIMELITGLLFVLVYVRFDFSAEALIGITLVSLLIIITVSDLAYMLIPDKILLFFLGLFFLEFLFLLPHHLVESVLGATVGFTLLLLISVLSKGGMGGGDIKLFALLGFVLGVKLVLLAFFFSTLLGAIGGIVGLWLNVFKKGKPIPFGPFIATGTILVFFFHEAILSWYFSFFIY
ncbi:prepilin peptidase [Bacillus sp. 2205SS5-2]|uniref:prepilin peptidase n=1 Tax=Bacillus sp. 2205SS5-2 TaxID=3109031 RepID=UPI00300418B0